MRNPLFYVFIVFFDFVCTTICRFAFFKNNNFELVKNPPAESILRGLKFDFSVICYALAPLLILQFYLSIFKFKKNKWISFLELFYCFLVILFILFVSVADIFYYKQFAAHINPSVIYWTTSPGEVTGMIWGEKDYRYGLLLATACVILFMFILRWLNVKLAFIKFSKINFLIYVLCAVTCFLGMRGGFRSLPLNMHDANVSEHYFFNQLSMSPVFQIYKTLFDRAQPLNIYDKDVETNACTLAKSYTTEQDSAEEIVHKNKPNVIIILLESMASFKLNQTPFLNSLIQKSIFFDSFYSAGEHTYNGIYSTLTGEPALMQKPMLRYMENASFTGMPEIFKSRGYYNFFQIPHSRYFDNMGKFLWKHHFDSLVDNSNIPSDLQGGSSWGTCDHKYYEFAIRNLNFISHKHKPFFTVLLSISDHQPYFIPSEQNIPKFSGPPSKAIVQYVDWSLKQFFTNAANQSWFNNTVFLILADHGFYTGKPDYPLPLAFHHIPCFIYSKKRENAPQIIHNFGSQQDLLPTLAAYLGFKYKDNPLSVNLFRTKRGFAYFSSDDYAGLLTHNRYSMLGTFGDVKVYNSTGQALPEKEAQADVQKILSLYRYAHYRSDNKRKKK